MTQTYISPRYPGIDCHEAWVTCRRGTCDCKKRLPLKGKGTPGGRKALLRWVCPGDAGSNGDILLGVRCRAPNRDHLAALGGGGAQGRWVDTGKRHARFLRPAAPDHARIKQPPAGQRETDRRANRCETDFGRLARRSAGPGWRFQAPCVCFGSLSTSMRPPHSSIFVRQISKEDSADSGL